MPIIRIETLVKAPTWLCFDLSRSIDLHTISTRHTGEKAIAGVVSGLIELDETVTWRAKHFGVWQHLTSRITEYKRPTYFVDEMVRGAFKRFRHEHLFNEVDGGTLMTDIFDYTSPLHIVGKVADSLFLKNYMTRLLSERDRVIKEYAESEEWQNVIKIERTIIK